jgi:sulfatase maturation enzyme AslB (radical SAM superfamily)
MLPFVHLHIDEHTNIKLCCNSTQIVKQYSADFNYATDPDFVEIRTKLLNGEKIKHCERCYQLDEANTKSFRYYHSHEWISKLKIKDITEVQPDLIFYDIRNDNTCNLGCRMCSPGFSSQLEKEFIKLNWPVSAPIKKFKLNEIIDFNNIKQLYIAGGEPTLIPEFKEFLQRSIEENRTDIELRIITNATNINKEFTELLACFSNIQFTISIDGYDQVNRYIRWPSNWLSLVENIKRLYTITSRISFNVTVSIWNISRLSELIKFLESEFSCPIIFLSIDEGEYSPFNFPNKEIVLLDLEKVKDTVSYDNTLIKEKVDYFISKTNSSIIDYQKLKRFFEYNDALDQSRNINLIDYIPELDQCRAYLNEY